MKYFLVTFNLLFSCYFLQSQINLVATYSLSPTQSGEFYLTKFSNAGYKYVHVDPWGPIRIYNVNHSLYKSIPFPIPQSGAVMYLSDQLFDVNNNIEYLFVTGCNNSMCVYIFDENGTQLFHKDSTSTTGSWESRPDLIGDQGILYNGVNYQLLLSKFVTNRHAWYLFDLPGTLPCISCSTFTTGGVVTSTKPVNGDPTKIDAAFYPNPVIDQLKLKYTLPVGYKNAEIRITDLQGKEIEIYRVDSLFQFIYIPSNYNNGMYVYTLVVDGVVRKSEKILISK